MKNRRISDGAAAMTKYGAVIRGNPLASSVGAMSAVTATVQETSKIPNLRSMSEVTLSPCADAPVVHTLADRSGGGVAVTRDEQLAMFITPEHGPPKSPCPIRGTPEDVASAGTR